MSKLYNKETLKKILIVFIMLQPILDTYILFEEDVVDIFKFSPSTIIRILFVIVISLYSFIIIKSKREWKLYISYIIVVILYTVFHLHFVMDLKTLNPNNFNYSNFNELFYIVRMLIPLFLIIVFSKIEFSKEEVKKLFYILFFMISGTLVISNLFKIAVGSYVTEIIKFNFIEWFTKDIYSSHSFYDTASRGFFSFANMISSLLFGMSSILFYRLYKECNLKNAVLVLIQMIAMFILGTKIATFGFILSLIAITIVYIFFCIKKEYKFKFDNFIVVILIACLWFVIYPFSPCKNRLTIVSNDTKENENIDYDDKELNDNESYEGKEDYIKNYLKDNYSKYAIKEDYILKYYPYQYDYIYWYNMLNESYLVKSDNRLLTISILDRIKEIDNRKLADDLFGISYSRMSNIAVLERDIVSQYYSLGIIGLILFVLPLFLVPICSLYKMFKDRSLNFLDVSIVVGLLSSLAGSYYCGNTMDNLTFSILYAFASGILIGDVFRKKKVSLKEKDITILALHLGYGGVEKYISSLCKMLDKEYNITIISTYKVLDKPAFDFSDKVKIEYLIDDKPNKEEFKKALKDKNIIHIIKEGIKSIKILYLRKEFNIRAIKNIDSKYIITTRSFHNKLVGNYAYSDIIKIATEHNYHNNDKKYIKTLITSIERFDYLVVVSNTLKEFYENKIGNTKCIYIPNVIDELPNKFTNLNKNNLINVGRIEKEKDQDTLVEVFKKVKEKVSDAKLYIIGDGSLKEDLANKISEYKLEDSIILTGFIGKEEIEEYMINSKIFILTSITESFGLVLIEAMSYKLPCIAFDTSDGAKNLLSDNNGILIENRNIDKMASEIIKLLNDNNKLKKLSDKSFNSCKKYLLDNVEKEWISLLNNSNKL